MRNLVVAFVGALAQLLAMGAARAEIIIDYDTTIDSDVRESIRVVEGTSPPTTVNVVEGAYFNTLNVYDSSIVHFSGGLIWNDVEAFDNCTVHITGDAFMEDAEANDHSTLNITGGETEHAVHASDFSTVNISGGAHELRAFDFSTANISGETRAGDVEASGSSTVHITGGAFVSEIISGTHEPGDTNDSRIIIYGTEFNYPYGEIPDAAGTLTGVLANGDAIDVPFTVHDDASIVLAIPEPLSLLPFSVGAFMVTFGRRQRRRAA